MMKKLPLHDVHQAAGAKFTQLSGWEVPAEFSSIDSEYRALQRSAGLIDLSCSGTLELKGDDRTRFLHGMVTNDVKSLPPGGGCHAAFLSPQGRMTADLRILCCGESFLLSTEAACREKLGPALRKYIIGDRPLLLDRSEESGLLSLQGPKATELLASMLSQVPALEPLYSHFEAALAGVQVRICRVHRTTTEGYDLIADRQDLAGIWNAILEKGKPAGVQPVGFESFNVHRIEAGIPWYGLDMDENTLPIEAGLEKTAISFAKGCYIGQESVARITYRGHVNRKLVGLTLSNSRPASKGEKIYKDDQDGGWVTSSEYSPALKTAIALGYLRREFLTPGNDVLIGTDGVGSRVTALPFFEPGPAVP